MNRVLPVCFGTAVAATALILGCHSVSNAAPQNKQPADNPNRIYQLRELRKVDVKIDGKHVFKSWVVDTDSKRQEGMMFLKDGDVKPDEAMLFVFAQSQPLSFWMKNTYIPLDIAYISEKKRILNIRTMKPHDETGIPSLGNAIYALEMKGGTCKRLGIKAGMRVDFPDDVKTDQ